MNQEQRFARNGAEREAWERRRRAKELFDEFKDRGLNDVQVRGFDRNIPLNDLHFPNMKRTVDLVFQNVTLDEMRRHPLSSAWIREAMTYVNPLRRIYHGILPSPLDSYTSPADLTKIGSGDGVYRERDPLAEYNEVNDLRRIPTSMNIYDTFLRMRYVQLVAASCFSQEVTDNIRLILTRFHERTGNIDIHPYKSCVEMAVRALLLLANHRFDRALQLLAQSRPGLERLQPSRNGFENKEEIRMPLWDRNSAYTAHPLCVQATGLFSLLRDTEMDAVYGISVPYFERPLGLADSDEQQQVINDSAAREGLDDLVEKYRTMMLHDGKQKEKFKKNFQSALSRSSDIIEASRGLNEMQAFRTRQLLGRKRR